MTERKLVPKIRFKGFKDEWMIYSFLKLFNIIDGDRGKNYPSGRDFSNIGDILFLSAANVTKNGFSFFDNQFITKKKSDSMGNGKLIKNDVVLTTRGSIGYVALYDKKTVKKFPAVRINSGMLILRPLRTIKSEFIYQYFFSSSAKKRVKSLSFGSAQPQLTKKDISNFKICRPCLNEQQKIGNLFAKLDRLLDLQQQKLYQLELLKKALLQKLFPKQGAKIPELRFKGFEKEWETKYMDTFVNRLDNQRAPVTASKRIPGITPYYGANGIQDFVKGYTHQGEFVLIAEDGANDLHDYPVKYVSGSIWVNNHAHVIQAKPGLADNVFISYAFKNKKIEPYLVGGGRAKLNAEVLMKMNLKLPLLLEQQKIGNLLAKVDRLIELEKKNITV